MVNPGGPSRGCLTCIQRKIRCDRQQPICTQCQKSKRQCGGYRNVTDIMFRDQSQIVFSKKRVSSQNQATKPDGEQLSEKSESVARRNEVRISTKSAQHNVVLIQPPKLNEESGLINFFANNFTCSVSNQGSNLFWVPRNFDDLLKEDCAKFSIQSVGAMALARLRRSSFYCREAQKKYGSALLSLTQSWSQHTEIVKDAILVTVLFLSFFEILASYESSSRRSWRTHLEGLGLLLNRREDDFLRGEFGARMLLQSRSQAILNALQTKTPVDGAFRNPAQRIQSSMSPRLVQSDKADMLLIRLATLQSQYSVIGPSDALLSELTVLDGDFNHWMENVPQSWSFSAQLCEKPSEWWWEARCDVYLTPVIAHIWNNVRAAQIIIYNLTQCISMRLSPHSENNLNAASHQPSHDTISPKLRHLVTDICATIPICYRPASASSKTSKPGHQPLLGTTYWLLWALEVIGSMREASVPLTEWVRQCLERIYELTGIVKAQVVAHRINALKNREASVLR